MGEDVGLDLKRKKRNKKNGEERQERTYFLESFSIRIISAETSLSSASCASFASIALDI